MTFNATLAAQQLTDGAVHQWRLNETTGTTATDTGSSPSNGSYVGGFTLHSTAVTADNTGNVSLNGTTGTVNLTVLDPPQAGAVASGAFSMEIAALFSSVASEGDFITNSNAASTLKGIRWRGGTTTMQIQVAFIGGVTTIGPGAFPFVTGQMYHLAVVWGGTATNLLSLYVNGLLIDSATTSGNYVPNASGAMFAGSNQNAGNYIQGGISDVAMYAGTLSAVQIAHHYFGGLPNNGSPLFADTMAQSEGGNIASLAVTITTTQTDDVVVLSILSSKSPAVTVSTVAGGSLTWAKRSSLTWTSNTQPTSIEVWWAHAPTTLTAASITVTWSATPSVATINAVAVAGCSTPASPWDINGSLPVMGSGADSVTGVSTTSSMPFPIASFGQQFGNSTFNTFETGWAAPITTEGSFGTIHGVGGQSFQGLGSALSGATITVGDSTNASFQGMIVDALSSTAVTSTTIAMTLFPASLSLAEVATPINPISLTLFPASLSLLVPIVTAATVSLTLNQAALLLAGGPLGPPGNTQFYSWWTVGP